ncbi:hypothetical protein CDIK_0487 [Cucumispora dikerogammari]|nr:hypothetical protein CDIK_0487 [Cucumispora dikerogammari]
MDRSNEFQALINRSTKGYRNTSPTQFNKKSDLQAINNISDLYNASNATSELTSLNNKLIVLKNNFQAPKYDKNPESQVFMKTILYLRTLKISNLLLYINLKLKKEREQQTALEETTGEEFIENQTKTNLKSSLVVEQNYTKKRDFTLINSQITEISQIMEDLTTQINLQGIKVVKIEELRQSSKTHIQKTFFEVEQKWRNVTNRRKIIILYFILWFIILIFFCLIKWFKS